MKLKTRLKELRLLKSFSQEELANELNVSKQAISNWENGRRSPDAQTLIKLANIFGVTIDYMLYRTNDTTFKSFKNTYLSGLSEEEIIEKLKILKQLENLGITFKPKKKND